MEPTEITARLEKAYIKVGDRVWFSTAGHKQDKIVTVLSMPSDHTGCWHFYCEPHRRSFLVHGPIVIQKPDDQT